MKRRCFLCWLPLSESLGDHGLGECVTICPHCLGAGCRPCLWSGIDDERTRLQRLVSAVWMNVRDWRWILFRAVRK